jgi:hypothetical protein
MGKNGIRKTKDTNYSDDDDDDDVQITIKHENICVGFLCYSYHAYSYN